MLRQRERITLVSILRVEEEKAFGIGPGDAGKNNPRLVVPLIVELLKDGAQGNDAVPGNARLPGHPEIRI